jgi:hypothetical protein
MERARLKNPAPENCEGLQAALAMLLQAYESGVQLRCPTAEVAPSWKALASHGLTTSLLATLLNAGHVELVVEKGSTALHRKPLKIDESSRLELTEQGVRFARQMLCHPGALQLRKMEISDPKLRPSWKIEAGELWWQGECIRRFRHDANSQRRVLDAFEELGWPNHIDDPLPGSRGVNCKQRLRETIKSLNRGQRPLRLRFRCDGTGEGIRWEAIA